VELLPDCLAFLGDRCELLGYPTQLMGNGDELFDEPRQEGDGGRFGGDGIANVSALKSGRSRELRRRALLAWASCSAMKARG